MGDFEALFRVLQRRTGARTQADVAIASGISPNDLTAWKKGRHKPTLQKLERIATHLHISREQLLSEIAAERGDVTRAPAAASAPVVAAFNSVPTEISQAVQELWQGQAKLLARFAEVVWQRALERAREGAAEAPPGPTKRPPESAHGRARRPAG